MLFCNYITVKNYLSVAKKQNKSSSVRHKNNFLTIIPDNWLSMAHPPIVAKQFIVVVGDGVNNRTLIQITASQTPQTTQM